MEEKRPLTDIQKEILSHEYRSLTNDLLLKILGLLAIVLLVAVIPGRKAPSLVDTLGWYKGFLISAIICIGIFAWNFISDRMKYKRDLNGGVTMIAKATIKGKIPSFRGVNRYLSVSLPNGSLKKFAVEKALSDSVRIGDRVMLEYAPVSELVFDIKADN